MPAVHRRNLSKNQPVRTGKKPCALNFLAGVRLIQLVLPHMKVRQWGRIINILSSGVKQPIDGLIQSNAARAAVAGAAKTLSREVAVHGILVNNICPGTDPNRASR